MPVTTKGDAYAIATAIYAGTRGQETVDIEELSERLYRAVEYSGFYTDEAKADLYAQLEESLRHDTPFDIVVDVITVCMERTIERGLA